MKNHSLTGNDYGNGREKPIMASNAMAKPSFKDIKVLESGINSLLSCAGLSFEDTDIIVV